MARQFESSVKRPRISIDVPPEIRRRVRIAAAKHEVSVRAYVVEAIERRLREDLGEDTESAFALGADADPVLAELWDNPMDAAYDRL